MTLSWTRGGSGISSRRRRPPGVRVRLAVRVGPPLSSALALPRVLVRRGAGSFAPSSSSAGFAAGLVLVPAACLVPVFAAAVFAAVDFVAVDFRERVRVLAG